MKDIEGVDVDPNDLNPHYTYIMSGESEHNTDFRKPVKKKSPKPKAKKFSKTITSRVMILNNVTGGDGIFPISSIGDSRAAGGIESDTPTGDPRVAYSMKSCPIGTKKDSCFSNLNLDKFFEVPPTKLRWTVVLLCTDSNSYLQTHNPFPNKQINESMTGIFNTLNIVNLNLSIS